MVSFTPGRTQFTPAFVAGFMKSTSSFTAEFEVETMYCYSIYNMFFSRV